MEPPARRGPAGRAAGRIAPSRYRRRGPVTSRAMRPQGCPGWGAVVAASRFTARRIPGYARPDGPPIQVSGLLGDPGCRPRCPGASTVAATPATPPGWWVSRPRGVSRCRVASDRAVERSDARRALLRRERHEIVDQPATGLIRRRYGKQRPEPPEEASDRDGLALVACGRGTDSRPAGRGDRAAPGRHLVRPACRAPSGGAAEQDGVRGVRTTFARDEPAAPGIIVV